VWSSGQGVAAACLGKLQGYPRPVDDVPPRVDVVGASVLVAQVVGVFPGVEAKKGRVPLHERRILIRRGCNRQPGAIVDKPRPAAAEALQPGISQLVLELRKAVERAVDCRRKVTVGLAAAVGTH